MEPTQTTPPTGDKNTPSNMDKTTVSDLHNEGIDIVETSRMSVDNEFSNHETPENAIPELIEEPPHISEIIPQAVPQVIQRFESGKKSFMPIPQAPRMENLGDKKPSENNFQTTPQKIPSTVPVEPAYEAPKNPLDNNPSIKRIRTFKSDAEEAIRYQNISSAQIAIAEQKKKEKENIIRYETEEHSSFGKLVFGVVILIIALLGGWYFWFSLSQSPEPTTATGKKIRTIITSSKTATVTITKGSDPLVLIGTRLGTVNESVGSVYGLIPVLYATSTDPAPIQEVLEATNIPSRLVRSLGPEYMFGLYVYATNGPFLILKDTFFQNAFSGMLEWEKDMANDLLPLIKASHRNESELKTGTHTFQDQVISNVDARVLKDGSGKTVLVYGFPNSETIVIATDQDTLKYVLEELLTVKTVQ